MKKLVHLGIVLAFLLALVPGGLAFADEPVEFPLTAVYPLMDGEMQYGTVTLSDDGVNLTITFVITELDWTFSATRLVVNGAESRAHSTP